MENHLTRKITICVFMVLNRTIAINEEPLKNCNYVSPDQVIHLINQVHNIKIHPWFQC